MVATELEIYLFIIIFFFFQPGPRLEQKKKKNLNPIITYYTTHDIRVIKEIELMC